LLKVQSARVVRTARTLEKPWFQVICTWREFERVLAAVMVEKSSRTRLRQLIET